MSTPLVTPAERIQLPHGLTFYDHQRECIQAYHAGAKRMFWLHHRQSGKGLGALGLLALAAFERPGLYGHVSPTRDLARRNAWDARDPHTGLAYLDVFHPALVVERNEAELSLVVRTKEAGKTSRIEFISAEDPDRLRGPAFAGVVLDEFATHSAGAEALHVVRPALAASGGWLLVTTTPKGLNHAHDLWKSAESAGGWFLSKKTIAETHRHDGTPIIALEAVEQERREGQREEWLQQEYFVGFTAALVSAYYGDLLTKAEGRICDLPYRPERPVLTGWDLGIADATAIVYVQEIGERLHVVNAEEYEGLSLPEIISRVQRHGYVYKRHLAPHDVEVRDYTAGITRREVAARLGFHFRTVPRLAVQEGVDAVRRIFPRLVFDRRRCARLLEALMLYQKVWDARGKVFRDAPLHNWASHYADSLRTFAVGYRESGERGSGTPRPQVRSGFDVISGKPYQAGPSSGGWHKIPWQP